MARTVFAANRSSKPRAMTMVARRRSASKMFSSARLAFACNSVRGPAPYSHDRQAGLAIVARIGTEQTRATANRLGKHRARVPCTVAARRARAGLGRWARGEQPPPNFQPNARPALDRGPHDLGEPELDRSSLSVTLSGPTLVLLPPVIMPTLRLGVAMLAPKGRFGGEILIDGVEVRACQSVIDCPVWPANDRAGASPPAAPARPLRHPRPQSTPPDCG
jgi:hypothetical protein